LAIHGDEQPYVRTSYSLWEARNVDLAAVDMYRPAAAWYIGDSNRKGLLALRKQITMGIGDSEFPSTFSRFVERAHPGI
jgi:hypothetical protein